VIYVNFNCRESLTDSLLIVFQYYFLDINLKIPNLDNAPLLKRDLYITVEEDFIYII
jgi:hypothetical protein